MRSITTTLVILCGMLGKIANASQAAGTETLVGIVGKDFILVGADSSVSQSIALTASNLDKIAPLSEPFYYFEEDDTPETISKEHKKQQRQPCVVAAAAGDAAGSDRLLGQLKAHAALEEYENGLGCDVEYITTDSSSQTSLSPPGLDVDDMANLARVVIAQALRSRTPFPVCLLIAGMSRTENPMAQDFVAEKVQRQIRGAWNAKKAVEESPADDSEKSLAASQSSSNLVPKLYWLDEYGSSQCVQYGAHGYGANFLLSILDQGFSKDMTREQAMELMKSCFQQLRTRYVINSPQPPCIKCVDVNGIRLIR